MVLVLFVRGSGTRLLGALRGADIDGAAVWARRSATMRVAVCVWWM